MILDDEYPVLKNTSYTPVWVLCVIVFLSFSDAYPILPTSYKPLLILVVVILLPFIFCWHILRQRIDRINFLMVLYFFYGALTSVVFAIAKYGSLSGFYDYFTTVSLGICAFIFYSCLLENSREESVWRAIDIVGKILLVVAFTEILCMTGLLPYGIKKALNMVFTTKVNSRMLLINNEPSWAAMTLLFFFTYYFSSKKRLMSVAYFIAILFAFSSQGIAELFIFIALMMLTAGRGRMARNVAIFSVFMLIIFIFFMEVAPVLARRLEGRVYGVQRLELVSSAMKGGRNKDRAMSTDGSLYVRVIYPLIGLRIFLDNPLGCGGGNYRYEFEGYVSEEGYPTYFDEVIFNIKSRNANPKNLIIRALAENGLIGGVLLFLYYISLYRRIKCSSSRLRGYFIYLFVIFLQFDSYVYLPALLAVALILGFSDECTLDRI